MRLRITFSKSGALRYSGHLDLQKLWERTIRRAGLPLAYTHGFHPGPKIQIASALPLGFIGRAEIVDIRLQEDAVTGLVPVQGDHEGQSDHEGRPYVEVLQRVSPPGLTILSVTQVDEASPALQTQVVSAEYEVTLLDPVDVQELSGRLTVLWQAETLPRLWKGKAYDLRPLIEALTLVHAPGHPAPLQCKGEQVRISMRLAAREGATARPEEVLDALGLPLEATRIERTRLILRGGVE